MSPDLLNLPHDWRAVPIGEAVSVSQYGLSLSSDPEGSTPIIGMKDIDGGKVLADDWACVSLTENERQRFRLNRGDILLNRTNSNDLVGKVALWDRDEEAVFASYLVRFVLDSRVASPAYVSHYLNADEGQRRLKQLATRGVSQANINPTTFQRQFLIALPPLSEQRRIAAVLDAWDIAVATTNCLIAAKRRRKCSLMENLLGNCLDQQPRPGWREWKLGDVFTERNERGGSERLLSITASRGVIGRDELERRDTSAEDKSAYKTIQPGDIGYNTMRMWQGVSALSKLEGIVSPAYTIVCPRPEIIAGPFAAQLFKLTRMIHRFWSYSQGLVDDTLMLKFPQFALISVLLPPIADQRRIAEILDLEDQAIRLLADLVERLSLQKRALMQKLLTGEWRVPASADALMPGGRLIAEAAE